MFFGTCLYLCPFTVRRLTCREEQFVVCPAASNVSATLLTVHLNCWGVSLCLVSNGFDQISFCGRNSSPFLFHLPDIANEKITAIFFTTTSPLATSECNRALKQRADKRRTSLVLFQLSRVIFIALLQCWSNQFSYSVYVMLQKCEPISVWFLPHEQIRLLNNKNSQFVFASVPQAHVISVWSGHWLNYNKIGFISCPLSKIEVIVKAELRSWQELVFGGWTN